MANSKVVLYSMVIMLVSLIVGFLIDFLSISAGSFFSLLTSGDIKVTDEVVATAILASYTVYQFAICVMMAYIIRIGKVNWKPRFFLYVVAPLTIFLLREIIPPVISLPFIMFLPVIATHHSLLIYLCRRAGITGGWNDYCDAA